MEIPTYPNEEDERDEVIRLRRDIRNRDAALKSADLQHIRLRAGLREALDGWARENDPADGDVLPSYSETNARIAELRKLLGGEP